MNSKITNKKVRTIVLTDFTIHGSDVVNPKSINRQVERSFKSGEPSGRAYTSKFWMTKDGVLKFIFSTRDSDGTEIRYLVPREGINVSLAPDLIDKIKLLNNN